jgi:hypothetical protein
MASLIEALDIKRKMFKFSDPDLVKIKANLPRRRTFWRTRYQLAPLRLHDTSAS